MCEALNIPVDVEFSAMDEPSYLLGAKIREVASDTCLHTFGKEAVIMSGLACLDRIRHRTSLEHIDWPSLYAVCVYIAAQHQGMKGFSLESLRAFACFAGLSPTDVQARITEYTELIRREVDSLKPSPARFWNLEQEFDKIRSQTQSARSTPLQRSRRCSMVEEPAPTLSTAVAARVRSQSCAVNASVSGAAESRVSAGLGTPP